jgi:hypothetical protein
MSGTPQRAESGDAPDITRQWRGLVARAVLVTATATLFFWAMGIKGVVFFVTWLVSSMIIAGPGGLTPGNGPDWYRCQGCGATGDQAKRIDHYEECPVEVER